MGNSFSYVLFDVVCVTHDCLAGAVEGPCNERGEHFNTVKRETGAEESHRVDALVARLGVAREMVGARGEEGKLRCIRCSADIKPAEPSIRFAVSQGQAEGQRIVGGVCDGFDELIV